MHEERLFRDLRDRLEQLAATHGARRILEVTIWVGALSHVDATAVRARWPATVQGTRAEGSRLVVERSEDPADPRATGVVVRSVRVDVPTEDDPEGTKRT
jgi:hydrogenase nickel incorporation protein HypA/HybF